MPESIADRYTAMVMEILDDVRHNEAASVQKAGEIIAHSITTGGILHVFGAGHSQLLAGDVTYRAGGLPWVNGVMDPALSIQRGAVASTWAEKIPELADSIFAQIEPRSADCTLIFCNSGVTPVSVRWAELCKERGLGVVSIVSSDSMDYFGKTAPTTIQAYSDLLIDNHCPLGDAGVIVDGGDMPSRFGPTSSVVGSFLAHWILMSSADELRKMGKEVSAFQSGHIEGAAYHNEKLAAVHKSRIRVFR